jgi:CheY-like chemotaxis protein
MEMKDQIAAPTKTVLVVEDERVMSTVIRSILKNAGYNVLTAADGATALKIARTDKPDLITLDIDLSSAAGNEGWDGFQVIEWLQHLQPERRVPFVIISAGNPAAIKKRAQSLHAFAYLAKPLDRAALLACVAQAIGAPSMPPATGAQATAGIPAPQPKRH